VGSLVCPSTGMRLMRFGLAAFQTLGGRCGVTHGGVGAQDRKRAAATMRAEVTRELEGLALTAERRAVEVFPPTRNPACEAARTARRSPRDVARRRCKRRRWSTPWSTRATSWRNEIRCTTN
jgi:hypothetical protein